MTRIYYDTEFHDTGSSIDTISIGLVAGEREYYAVSADFDQKRVYGHEWLRANVMPHLPLASGPAAPDAWLDLNHPHVKPRAQIAEEVYAFIAAAPEPELWAYYSAFDHVALAWLAGRPMVQLPRGVPWRTNDLEQEAARLGNPKLPVQEAGEHYALADARHNQVVGEYLAELAERRVPLNGRLYDVAAFEWNDGFAGEERWTVYGHRV
ncbi:3'-5' exoribonuclease domain-containing protein [Planomonospora sp. ID82291]|uniref:3'-5' exoribonuclease domain-containing protein n=1 Tax=Planomonospora sp. ID82291 TaxID=2738136 RepID=UPI0018C423E3|nr:3'-5' exoribonuclease [Planomonospora sp. ID82291]MBG0818310.1 3'-5' exoribonuclease [Planomonospora sp. ID82291]